MRNYRFPFWEYAAEMAAFQAKAVAEASWVAALAEMTTDGEVGNLGRLAPGTKPSRGDDALTSDDVAGKGAAQLYSVGDQGLISRRTHTSGEAQ